MITSLLQIIFAIYPRCLTALLRGVEMNNFNNNFFDILNLASLIVGIQNLNENREQSPHNDIEAENQKQAQFLLAEIRRQFAEIKDLFAEQRTILRHIVDALEKINEMESNCEDK
jgi:hypothetical protein